MIPETLDAWTLERLHALLGLGAFENDRLEWKEQLPREDTGRRRIRLAMAAFANGNGGFVVFGIKDDATLSPVDRLVGIPKTNELVHELAAISKRCEPWIEHAAKNPPIVLDAQRHVHVIHVPASARRPHGLIEDEAWRFPIRVSGGSRSMTWEELRDGFSDLRRRRRLLAVLRNEVLRLRDIVGASSKLAHSWRYAFKNEAIRAHARVFDGSQIERVLAEVFDDLGPDAELMAALNEVRELAREWDAGAVEFAATVRFGSPSEADIARRDGQVSGLGFRVSTVTAIALAGLERISRTE